MATIPIHLQYHAAAVALNNAGVSLLERSTGIGPLEQRRLCRAAMDAFQNSVALMKTVSLLTGAQEPDEQSQFSQLEEQAKSSWPTVQDMVQRSSQALFYPPPKETSPSNSPPPPSCLKNLKVVSLEDSGVAVQQILKENEKEAATTTSPEATTILIRIEKSAMGRGDEDGETTTTEENHGSNIQQHDVDTSIILYNFGASFRCMAAASSANTHTNANTIESSSTKDGIATAADELLIQALSISEISYNIFQDHFWSLESIQESGIWIEYLPLAIVFLQNLTMLASRTGGSLTAADTELKLTNFRELFLDQQVQILGGFQRGTAAAA